MTLQQAGRPYSLGLSRMNPTGGVLLVDFQNSSGLNSYKLINRTVQKSREEEEKADDYEPSYKSDTGD